MDSAAAHARAYGRPDARVVAVQHPLAALAPEAVMQRADAVVERIIDAVDDGALRHEEKRTCDSGV